MTRAREHIIDLQTTPYYHCMSRCVRRAFLCGEDHVTGNNYEHRKAWVVERLAELANVFAIDVCAYSVMSNHFHVVLRVNKAKALGWDDFKVIAQWEKLFSLPLIVQQYRAGTALPAVARKAQEVIGEWRQRLMDISWFMRGLNEHLARRANAEDGCRGRFWEGRFKSQALLDEAAILTCMSYVDLNPIRAGLCETPEQSDYTSIQQRIQRWQAQQQLRQNKQKTTSQSSKPVFVKQKDTKQSFKKTDSASTIHVPLMPLVKQSQDPHVNAVGYATKDYLELVDWAGRAIREGKRGSIPNHLRPILERLDLRPDAFLSHVGQPASDHEVIREQHPKALGSVDKLKALAAKFNQQYICGVGYARLLYQA